MPEKSDTLCGFLIPTDPSYPRVLSVTLKKPPTLYWRGNKELLEHARIIVVVGSRHPNQVAERSLDMLLQPLGETDCVIASGLAIGLDARSHMIALAKHIPTIAVVGSSVEPDEIYPPSNRTLARRILESNGLILSPFPPGTSIERYNFPIRNRVLGSIGRLVIVAAAAERSGALSTVAAALDAGRDVAVIPGPITDPLYAGSNALLKRGAMAVTCANDIREYFSLEPLRFDRPRSEDPLEDDILKSLAERSQRIDDLIRNTTKAPSSIAIIITKLEIAGHITRRDDGTIALAR